MTQISLQSWKLIGQLHMHVSDYLIYFPKIFALDSLFLEEFVKNITSICHSQRLA